MKRGSGFTLLEILIALAILALTSIALLGQTRHSVMTRTALHDKTIGLWLVESELEEMRAFGEWREPGISSELLELEDKEWTIVFDVTETNRADMHRVEVAIREKSASGEFDKPIVALTGFIGRY